MNIDHAIELVVEFIEFMDTPANALGIWLAVTGAIAGAHFVSPLLFK